MSIGRRIELHIAVLTVIGGVLLGLGGANLILPIGLLVAALWATRRKGGQPQFALPPAAVNVSIFAIALFSAWRLAAAYGTREVILLGEAFAALQAVLLFERKTARARWDLFSLSLVTVLLSTALVQGPLYALGLLTYGYCVLATLGLICLERARLVSSGVVAEGRMMAAARVRGSWWRLLGIAVSTTMVGPLALFLRFPERVAASDGSSGAPKDDPRDGSRGEASSACRPADIAGPGEWGGRRAAASRSPSNPGKRDGKWDGHQASKSWRGSHFSEKADWAAVSRGADDAAAVGREFWWRTGRMTFSALVVAAILFCLAPRFGRIEFELPPLGDLPWQPLSSRPLRVVGFTDRVRLGEMGTLSEDQRRVFEFQLVDNADGRVVRPRGNLYLRGAMLNRYRAGRWEFAESGGVDGRFALDLQSPSAGQALVRQRITVEPSAEPDLFVIWPFQTVGDDPPVRTDSRSGRLRRRRDMLERSFTFEVVTTALRDGVQSPWMPTAKQIDEELHLDWPAEVLPGLARLAQRWLDEAQIPADDPTARARLLESRLLDPSRFRYSLVEASRDPAADPIEDFVTRHPEGNCEYFASALALMLRSQGIPTRLIVGFRADEYSESSGTYRVRQSHAHAWVEAYVRAERLPVGVARQDGISDWSRGAWLRLDPTPSFAMRTTGVASLSRQVEDWLSLLHSFWRDHVLSMSSARQREALYQPLVVRVRQAATDLANPAAWDGTGTQTLLGWAAWIVWFAGVAGCLLAAVVWLLRLRLRVRRRSLPWSRARSRGPNSADGRPAVAFYRRFEALLARCGHVRTASQTPQEFVQRAAECLAAACGEARVADWARQIVQAFYEVRFGAATLAGDRAAAVEAALQQLGQAARRKSAAQPSEVRG